MDTKQILPDHREKIPLESKSVDIIVSNAVLEHVQNPDILFSSMSSLLKPGGIMVHSADLKSHELHYKTDLDFLTISDRLWKWMTFYRGAPNRLRKSDFEKLLQRYDFELESFKVTSSISPEKIESFKTRYPEHASRFTTDDLLCGGFIFAAQKI